jgi:hypothetical protein
MKKITLMLSLIMICSIPVFSQTKSIKEPKISMYRLKMYAYGAIAENNYLMMNIHAKDTSARAQKLAKISYERFRYYYALSYQYADSVTRKNDTGNTIVF